MRRCGPALGICLVWVLACLAMPTMVMAQVGGGALTGVITDGSGQAVPGASVTATAVGTNQDRTVVTAADGGYSIQGLAPAAYRVRVELNGVQPLTREGIRVSTGETVRLDL